MVEFCDWFSPFLPQFVRDSKLVPRFDEASKDFTPCGLTYVRRTPSLTPRLNRHNEIELSPRGREAENCH